MNVERSELSVERSAPRGAVFLSYASQDAEAARRICEALRAADVEVWFDQSELVGGDVWDQKIRRQIKECMLFVPIVSAATQARREGYFRLEWKLADDRTHLMAKGTPFLVPVCIDETKDWDAIVPDSFMSVQWTRLPGGETPAKFTGRVKQLLGGEGAPASSRQSQDARWMPALHRQQPARPWLVPAILGVAIIAALAIWQPWWKSAPAPTVAVSATKSPIAPPSEARELVARVWAMQLDSVYVTRAKFEAADRLCERAATLDATDAEVWAAWAYTDAWLVQAYERDLGERNESVRTKAAQAMSYAPDSFNARLAQAAYFVLVSGGRESREPAHAEAAPEGASNGVEPRLRQLATEQPAHPGVLRLLHSVLRRTGQEDAAREIIARLERVSGYAATACQIRAWDNFWSGRLAEAKSEMEKSLALEPGTRTLSLQGRICLEWDGDLGAAKRVVDAMPPELLLEDDGAAIAARVFRWRREPEKTLQVLDGVTRDWLASNHYSGPKALLAGEAFLAAGKPDAARNQFRHGLKLVDDRLTAAPGSPVLLSLKLKLLEDLGEEAGAAETRRLLAQFDPRQSPVKVSIEARIAALESATEDPTQIWRVTAAALRLDPGYDDLRAHPRFQALLARAEADPRLSPVAAKAPAVTPHQAPAPDPKSVAVLAFDNLSDDKANDYFSDGISEELINGLGRVAGLAVKGRTSAFYFKGKQASSAEIAHRLGVTYLVRGSVRKAGDKVRIAAQLTRAVDDEVLWSSEPVTREMHDVLAVQEEIAGLIAKALSLKLGTASSAATVAINPEAYGLYLEGRQAWNLRNATADGRAEALFRRALQLDPNFAHAHAGLADLMLTRDADLLIRDGRLRAEIRSEAECALALDPSLAEPHATLGALASLTWEFDDAEREFHRAIALNPSYPWAHLWRSQYLMTMGQVEDALRENRLALEADPLAPRIASAAAELALLAGRLTEAIAFADQSLALQPDGLQPKMWKAEALLLLGRSTEALTIARGVVAADPKRSSLFAYVLARAGGPQELALAAAADELFIPNRTRARLAAGRVEEAFTALEAEATNEFALQFVLFHPAFDVMRSDARFAKLLARFRLTDADARAQAWRAAHPPEKPEGKK